MKRIKCVEPGRLDYEEVDLPKPGIGEALLKIKRVGICGTDLHAFEGVQPFFHYPRILGHELAADFVGGDVEGFSEGDKVTVVPYFTKGEDIASRMGKPNCATDMQVLGVHVDGGMSEYVVVPADSLKKYKGLDYEDLVLIEPLSIGAHAINRAQLGAGEVVLVVGAGPIGLGIIALANAVGAQVIAMDMDVARLEFAKKLGASHTIQAQDPAVGERIGEITSGDMVTTVFDATGNIRAIEGAFQYMSHGGKYVLVGLQSGAISFSHPEFHKREGTLMSSRNALKSDFDHVASFFQQGKLKHQDFITKEMHVDEVVAEFPGLLKPEVPGIKTVIHFD